MAKLKFDKKGWNAIVKEIIDSQGVDRMKRVADECNAYVETDGYMVSVEGDDDLNSRDYRATVITTNGEAIRDNAEHNRLVQNLHRAGG